MSEGDSAEHQAERSVLKTVLGREIAVGRQRGGGWDESGWDEWDRELDVFGRCGIGR